MRLLVTVLALVARHRERHSDSDFFTLFFRWLSEMRTHPQVNSRRDLAANRLNQHHPQSPRSPRRTPRQRQAISSFSASFSSFWVVLLLISFGFLCASREELQCRVGIVVKWAWVSEITCASCAPHYRGYFALEYDLPMRRVRDKCRINCFSVASRLFRGVSVSLSWTKLWRSLSSLSFLNCEKTVKIMQNILITFLTKINCNHHEI